MKGLSNKTIKYQSGNCILRKSQQLGALVLGDCNSAMDKRIHKQFMIQTIISIGQQAMPIKEKLPNKCQHHFYDIHDNKSQKVSAQFFDEMNKVIEQGRKNGGVLVHCYAGVSRSSTFVIAYIMQKQNKNYDQARQEVKVARKCIYPNDGFVNHLKNYSKVLQKRECQRLMKIQQQKRLSIDESIVKSARKSIRGAVKGADVSPQKVKQMVEQSKNTVHQLIIEKLSVIKEQNITANKNEDNSKEKSNYINGVKTKQNGIAKMSQTVSGHSNKITKGKQKQEIRLPSLKQITSLDKAKLQYKVPKSNTIKFNKEQNKKQPIFKSKAYSYKQRSAQTQIKPHTSIILNSGNPQSIKKEEERRSLRQSKPNLSHKKQINQALLNEHERKLKKIYQTKINVK